MGLVMNTGSWSPPPTNCNNLSTNMTSLQGLLSLEAPLSKESSLF